jgi:uncharacterized protein DUF6155
MVNANPLTVKKFKEWLINQPRSELEAKILELFRQSTETKQFFTSKINPEFLIHLIQDTKHQIESELDPQKRGKPSFIKINKFLSKAAKLGGNPNDLAGIRLLVVELALIYQNEWNPEENFYDNIYSQFNKACNEIAQTNSIDLYDSRIVALLEICDLGYGLGFSMPNLYNDIFH